MAVGIILVFLVSITAIFSIMFSSPVHSIFAAILVFVQAGLCMILLGTTYVGFVFFIVYIGAIAILFIFVVMMLNTRIFFVRESVSTYSFLIFSTIVGVALEVAFVFGLNLASLISFSGNQSTVFTTLVSYSDFYLLGSLIYSSMWFLLGTLALFVAMVGSIYLVLGNPIIKQTVFEQHIRGSAIRVFGKVEFNNDAHVVVHTPTISSDVEKSNKYAYIGLTLQFETMSSFSDFITVPTMEIALVLLAALLAAGSVAVPAAVQLSNPAVRASNEGQSSGEEDNNKKAPRKEGWETVKNRRIIRHLLLIFALSIVAPASYWTSMNLIIGTIMYDMIDVHEKDFGGLQEKDFDLEEEKGDDIGKEKDAETIKQDEEYYVNQLVYSRTTVLIVFLIVAIRVCTMD